MNRYLVAIGLAACLHAACDPGDIIVSEDADALRPLPPPAMPSGDAATTLDASIADAEPAMPPTPNTIQPRFAPEGTGFYRVPWPSDARKTEDGRVDLTDFPGSGGFFEKIRTEVQDHVYGFSLLPVIYLAFDTPLEADWLPTVADSVTPESPVQLLRLGADGCGQRIPINMAIRAEADQYIEANVLRVRNTWGTVIEPGVPHALMVLRTFGGGESPRTERPEAFDAALAGDGSRLSASLAPLVECLDTAGIAGEDIAVATVFTPQDPRIHMKALHDWVTDPDQVETRPPSPLKRSGAWSRYRLDLTTLEGTVPMPIFQDGETPYNEMGGRLIFDADGRPVVQRWEDVPVAITYKALDNPPSPRPALVFLDGTGWSRWTHVNDNWMLEALNRGYVIYGFMPQFHGDRAEFVGSDALATFNLLNPAAGRQNFMQQVAETSYFVRVIREQLANIEGVPEADHAHLVYGGQSQGSLVGAIHASVSDQFVAYALNGVSSSFTLTMLHREDLLDFELLIRGFLEVGNGEFGLYHPGLQLVQMGADTVDPHTYAPYWKGWVGNPRGNNVFVVNGKEDRTTVAEGMANLAMVSNAAPIATPGWDVDPDGVWTGAPVSLPISGNVTSHAGDPLTLATYLDGERGHSTIYQRRRLRNLAFHLWETARNGAAALVSDREFQCDDGADGDQDGDIDCEDPDCATLAPCKESICDDGIDNDENGTTDCADAACEEDEACIEDCSNEQDEDGNGLTDCEDPQCENVEPCVEKDCRDQRDGDGDELIDCDDPDCANSGACREQACKDRADNDQDGTTDCDDPDCFAVLACPEAICNDGVDNNTSGRIDCDDPGCALDPACVRPHETDCEDGADNDDDMLIDCDDPDCGQASACDAIDDCADLDLGAVTGVGVYRGTFDDAGDDHPPGDCTRLGSGDQSPDVAIRWTAPAAGRYRFSTYGSRGDTVLALYPANCDYSAELACDDDQRPIATSDLAYTAEEGQEIVIIVSGYDEYIEGDLLLHIWPE